MFYRALLTSPLLLQLLLVCCMDHCKMSNAAAPVVTTTFGKLVGTGTAKGRSFFGVPYAKSPTGNRRFVDPEAWDEQYPGGSRNATAPGAICLSNSQKSGAEDCLFANFFTPANTGPQSRLPVLGGANFLNLNLTLTLTLTLTPTLTLSVALSLSLDQTQCRIPVLVFVH